MNDDNCPMWLAAVISIITAVIGFFVGGNAGTKFGEESAVKAGVGEFYIDHEHNKQFRFKPSDVAPTPTPQPERANAD